MLKYIIMPEENNTSKTPNTTESNNKQTTINQTSQNSDSKKDEKKPEDEKEPTLAEDYDSLKNMNLLKNVMIRMQFGRYPNKKIDAILKRRMDFDESKYQGTHVVRIIISIMAMFFICTAIYIVIWLIASMMNLNDLKETSSLVLSLLFFGSCGYAIFNNISVPDEKKLKEAIKERMTQIESELKIEPKSNDNNNPQKQNQTNNQTAQ